MMTNYNPNYIKRYQSYTIKDICTIYSNKKLSERTVLKWINEDGLPLIDNSKPYMVYGKILYEFLRYRNMKYKEPMHFSQFNCLSERKPVKPKNNKIFADLDSGLIRCKAVCPCCNGFIYRVYSLSDYDKLKSTFSLNDLDSLSDNGVCSSIIEQSQNIALELKESQKKIPTFDTIIKNIRYNAANERVKYKYFNTKLSRFSNSTKDDYIKALHTYEEFLGYADLSLFNFELGKDYKNYVLNRQNEHGKNTSYSIQYKELKNVQNFLYWLIHQKGYKSKIDYNDIDSLTVERNLIRKSRTSGGQESYLLEDINMAFLQAPEESITDRRNKAVLACFILFTPRITALLSAKVKDVKFDRFEKSWYLDQTRLETKFANKFVSFAYNVEPYYLDYLQKWLKELKDVYNCSDNDYLLPKIDSRFDKSLFNYKSIDNKPIGVQSARNGLKKIFENAGLDYINPHSFRHTIKRTADRMDISGNQNKALALNFGHSPSRTIDCHYGDNTRSFQAKYINQIDFTKYNR